MAVCRVWDLVVDIRGSGLAWMVPARRRAVMRRRPGHKTMQLAAVLGLDPPPLPVAWTEAADRDRAAALLPQGPLIALGPTANTDLKIWPAERFVALFQALAAGPLPGARAVVFGGPDARERPLAAPVLAALPDAIDLCGALSLPEAAAALARCELFVGNDSGLMHLAAAAGTPTLGLFGPTPSHEYSPAGRRTAIARSPTGRMAGSFGRRRAGGSRATAGRARAGMTRLAHVMAGAVNGGAELFFERLCLAQHASGEEVLPVIRADAARAARLRAGGLDPVQLRFGTALDLLTTPRLARALRRFAPRVVVAWMNRANMHAPRGDWTLVGRLGGYYDLRYYRRCDASGGQYARHRRLAARPGLGGRAHPLFAEFRRRFRRDPASSRRAARERNCCSGWGACTPTKASTLPSAPCRACPARCWRSPAKGRNAAPCRTLARREGVADRLQFLGWRHDAGALLRAADLFVCSSRIEPLGNMVIEAWSAGCPVVAAAAAGPAELLRDGADGTVVPAEDPAALAAGIAGLLEDPDRRSGFAQAGRLRFEVEFAAAPVVARWRGFLAGLDG